MKQIVVKLGGYGDFDTPNVYSTWLSPEGMGIEDVKVVVEGIRLSNSRTDNTANAEKELKQNGFIKLKSINCLVGGDL